MGLIFETAGVFSFLRNCFDALPLAIKLLIVCTFGIFLLLGLMQAIKG